MRKTILFLASVLSGALAGASEIHFCPRNASCTIHTVFYEDAAPEDIQDAPTFADADIFHICDAGTESTGDVQAADITDEGQSMSIALAAADVNGEECHLTFIDQTATKTYLDKHIIIVTYGTTGRIDTDSFQDATTIAAGGFPVGGFAAGAVTAAAIATDAIGAAEIAADAIGAAEAGFLTDSTGFAGANIDASISSRSTVTTAQVNTEVDTALADINLDHWVGTATGIPAVPAGTWLDLTLDDGTAVYNRTTDSLQAIADSGGGGPTAAQIVDEWETQSQADPTGFHVNVLEVAGTAQTANDNGADINAILVDTGEIGAAGVGLTAVPWNAAWDAQVESEVDDGLVAQHLDHLFGADYDPASKPGVATALLNELVESDAGVSRYTANALEQAPSGGLSAEQTRAALGGFGANIDTATSQTVFDLDNGPASDDLINDVFTVVVTDASDSAEPACHRRATDWTGATQSVTIDSACGFTVVAGDDVVIMPNGIGDAVILADANDRVAAKVEEWNGVALATTNPLPNAADGAAGGLPTDSTGKTAFNDLDAAGVRSAVGLASANLDTQLADVPTVSEFNARTLATADYFDPAADTVANVTTVAGIAAAGEASIADKALLDMNVIVCTVDSTNGAPTTTTAICDLTDPEGGAITGEDNLLQYKRIELTTSGSPPPRVGDYAWISSTTWSGANSELTITWSPALPAAPADGDVFMIEGL